MTAMNRGERAGEEVEERRDSRGGYAWQDELWAAHRVYYTCLNGTGEHMHCAGCWRVVERESGKSGPERAKSGRCQQIINNNKS